MNAHDPMFEALDRLAAAADRTVVRDRMPDIRHRVQVARQRRVAGVAAVAVLAVGVGAWLGRPPTDRAPEPAPEPQLEQTVTIEAEAASPTRIEVAFTVAGTSSAYVAGGGGPVAAGPFTMRLSVDGEPYPGTPDPGDVACEPGGRVSSYAVRFPRTAPESFYDVAVSGPGEHEIEVRAAYCADGELLESTGRTVVTVPEDAADELDRQRTDLDDDGRLELVQVLTDPSGEPGAQVLRVTWRNGEISSAPLGRDYERGLDVPYDLDADGSVEIVLSGGGGEFLGYEVFRVAEDRSLVAIHTVNEAGEDEPLTATASEGSPLDETWQVSWTPGFFVSWRAREPFPEPSTAVDVRRWVLEGDTMTLLDQEEDGCYQVDLSVTTGGC